MCYVYLIKTDDAIKIGVSTKPRTRLTALQTAHYLPLTLFCSIRCASENEAYELEGLLHRRYAANGISGEWFRINPETIMSDLEFAASFSGLALSFEYSNESVSRRVVQQAVREVTVSRKIDLAVKYLKNNPKHRKLSGYRLAELQPVPGVEINRRMWDRAKERVS